MMKRIVAVVALGFLAGCSQSGYGKSHGIYDASIGQQDTGPAFVIDMPNGYMNVAFKCHGKDGIYAHTRIAAPVIVPNDPNCH